MSGLGVGGCCGGVGVLGSLYPTHSCHFCSTTVATNISTPVVISASCSCCVMCACSLSCASTEAVQ
eukprot:12886083-Prorocentrum_lima.AAC.1